MHMEKGKGQHFFTHFHYVHDPWAGFSPASTPFLPGVNKWQNIFALCCQHIIIIILIINSFRWHGGRMRDWVPWSVCIQVCNGHHCNCTPGGGSKANTRRRNWISRTTSPEIRVETPQTMANNAICNCRVWGELKVAPAEIASNFGE